MPAVWLDSGGPITGLPPRLARPTHRARKDVSGVAMTPNRPLCAVISPGIFPASTAQSSREPTRYPRNGILAASLSGGAIHHDVMSQLSAPLGLFVAMAEDHRDTLQGRFSHEFRTPLVPIVGYTNLLQCIVRSKAEINRTELHEIAEALATSGGRLLNLVENIELWSLLERMAMLELSTPNSTEVMIRDSGSCRANTLHIAKSFRREADLRMKLGPVFCRCVGSDWLDKVTGHLVENAFKFSPPGSLVHVESCSTPNSYVLIIQDAGRGLTPEEIAKIGAFTQFGREKSEQQGLGLGLRIAQLFTRCSGGTLHIEPVSDGPGTRVTLRLPGVSSFDALNQGSGATSLAIDRPQENRAVAC